MTDIKHDYKAVNKIITTGMHHSRTTNTMELRDNTSNSFKKYNTKNPEWRYYYNLNSLEYNIENGEFFWDNAGGIQNITNCIGVGGHDDGLEYGLGNFHCGLTAYIMGKGPQTIIVTKYKQYDDEDCEDNYVHKILYINKQSYEIIDTTNKSRNIIDKIFINTGTVIFTCDNKIPKKEIINILNYINNNKTSINNIENSDLYTNISFLCRPNPHTNSENGYIQGIRLKHEPFINTNCKEIFNCKLYIRKYEESNNFSINSIIVYTKNKYYEYFKTKHQNITFNFRILKKNEIPDNYFEFIDFKMFKNRYR